MRAKRRLAYIGGKGFADNRQFLAYNLACQVDIRFPVELNPYNGKPVGGRRTYPAYSRSTVYSRFNRKSNQLFHFLGCHTVGFGHDDHCRGVQVGKHVYFRMHGGVSSPDEQENGRAEHNQSVVQGVMYDFI